MARLSQEQTRARAEASGLDPLEPYVDSKHKWLVACRTCGAQFRITYAHIKRGQGCRACGLRKQAATVTAKAAARRGFAVETFVAEYELEPLEDFRALTRPWRVRCLRCGHDSTITVDTVLKRERSPCRYCANWATHPDDAVAILATKGLEPLEAYPGAFTPWRVRCLTCGHEVTPMLANLVKRPGRGCRMCRQQQLRTRAAAMALTADQATQRVHEAGMTPVEPYPGTVLRRWRLRCDGCGTVTATTVNKITTRGRQCPACARTDRGLPATMTAADAAQVMRAAGLEPLEPYVRATRPWKCQCTKCGQTVSPSYHNVRKGRGCIRCSRKGIDPQRPAIVYLVTHEQLHAIKVGIGAVSEIRVRDHERHGWQALHTWTLPRGTDAFAVEREVLRWWRDDLGAPQSVDPGEMPHAGATETASLALVDPDETVEVVDRLVRAAHVRHSGRH